MYKFLFVLAAVVALSGASDVLDLTTENFASTVAAHSPILVEFYAPWCGHCKSLAPEYEKAATALKEKGIVIAKVDATAHEALASQYEIRGFPTMKLFKNGVFVQDYSGPRDAAGIAAFMIKKGGDPYTIVSSAEEVEAFLAKEDQGVVVGYFSDLESDDFLDFKQVADLEMNIPFLLLNNADAATGCMPSEVSEGVIAVFAKDGSKHVFAGEDIEEQLSAFAGQHAFPQSMDLNPELFSSFLEKSTIVVSAYDFNADNAAETRAMAIRAISGFPSLKQMFADTNQWAQPLVRMGVVSGNVWPAFVAFRGQGEQPISWDEEVPVTEEGLKAWMGQVQDGTAKTWEKSEAIPESNDGNVKVVVAKNFKDVVLDGTVNVLVEFYAPWCGHCKNLVPIYEAVGEHFAGDDAVVIAKMDATANHVDSSYGIKGFPSLKLFPANSEGFVDYNGDRTMEDIIEFVTSNRK